jgi:hypothetical protein
VRGVGVVAVVFIGDIGDTIPSVAAELAEIADWATTGCDATTCVRWTTVGLGTAFLVDGNVSLFFCLLILGLLFFIFWCLNTRLFFYFFAF